MGSSAADESVELGRLRGLDLAAHRSRPVTPQLVAASDLVLTMSERQRDAVAPMAPRTAGRVFTLREFDRLTAAVDAGRCPDGLTLAERVTWWRDQAHLARPVASRAREREDVSDPIGKPWESWVRLGDLFDEVLPRLGRRLRG